jgi:hypothetical protein
VSCGRSLLISNSELDREPVVRDVERQLATPGEHVGGQVGEDDPPAGQLAGMAGQVGVAQMVRTPR